MTHAHLIKALGYLAERTRTGRKGLRWGEITGCAFQARLTVHPTPHQLQPTHFTGRLMGNGLQGLPSGSRGGRGGNSGTRSNRKYFHHRWQEPELIIISVLQMRTWRLSGNVTFPRSYNY